MHEKIRAYLTPQEYNLILENSCADLFATDGRGRIIYANDDSVRVLGCPLEKLLTMDIYPVSYTHLSALLRRWRAWCRWGCAPPTCGEASDRNGYPVC